MSSNRPRRLSTLLTAILLLAPVTALATGPGADPGGQQEEEGRQPPPPEDEIGGLQLALLGGSQFRATSSGQVGAAVAYFFKPNATFGFELEGGATFGPGGDVLHGMANVILQAGARTSRIVPYVTGGVGVFRAEVSLPSNIQGRLDEFGLQVPRNDETAPFLNFGGGARYYLKEGISLRGDYREFRALLDLQEGNPSLSDRLFALRRIAAMISFEF